MGATSLETLWDLNFAWRLIGFEAYAGPVVAMFAYCKKIFPDKYS